MKKHAIFDTELIGKNKPIFLTCVEIVETNERFAFWHDKRGHTAKLRQLLNTMGVVCYYTFSVKGFQENYAMFTPNCRSLQESEEEKIFGRIPSEKIGELNNLIKGTKDLGKNLLIS